MIRTLDVLVDVLPEATVAAEEVAKQAGSLAAPEVVEPPVVNPVHETMSAEAAELFAQLRAIKAEVRAFERSYFDRGHQPYIFDPFYANALKQTGPIVAKLKNLGYPNVPELWG